MMETIWEIKRMDLPSAIAGELKLSMVELVPNHIRR